ncbi:cytochrome c3 family protein [Desulfolithobacter sp.]
MDCLKCHAETFGRAMGMAHIHAPVLEQNCVVCHVAAASGSSDSLSAKEKRPESVKSVRKPKKIHWLKNHYQPDRNHFFLVPAKRIGETIFIRKAGPEGRPEILSYTTPPLKSLPRLENDRKPPVISDVHFLGIERGVIPGAVISWKTDEPATVKVLYGIRRPEENTTPYNPVLATRHTTVLSPVKLKKTYLYMIEARDMFGNVARSPVHRFSGRQFSPGSLLSEAPVPDRSVQIEHHFYAKGNHYLFHFAADQPTYLSIGTTRRSNRKKMEIQGEDTFGASIQHVPLKSSYETNMMVCRACHEQYWHGVSHPINVSPSRNVKIPENYPVLSDGRITCMSCHEAHASQNEARIRRASKRDLCIDCHRNYG